MKNVVPNHLECLTCGETKPVSHFHEQARSKTGYASSCRTCVNKKRRSKKAARPGAPTRLMTLVKKGNLEGVKKLIETATAPSLNSLLITCATPYFSYLKTNAHAELARYLIQNGANPDAKNSEEERVLFLAARSGRLDLVEAILEGGAIVDFFTAAALLDLPVLEGYLKEDRLLGKARDITGFSALHYCAGSALGRASDIRQSHQLRVIDLLLGAGADPDLEVGLLSATPLAFCCISGGSIPVIRKLVRAGANPNHPWTLRSALRHFKQKGSAENPVADALVDCGCEVDGLIDDDRTCLHLYSHHEEKQAVAWLLNNGALVHAKTADGRTPLHLAAERNSHTFVIQLLVGHGAPIDSTDSLGMKPIDYAKANGKDRVVTFLSAE